jgi:hypothetical protein
MSRLLLSLAVVTVSASSARGQSPAEPSTAPVAGSRSPDPTPGPTAPSTPAAPPDIVAPQSPAAPASPAAPPDAAAPQSAATPASPTTPQRVTPPAGAGGDDAELPAAPPPVEEHTAAAAPDDGHPKPTLDRFHEALDAHGRWVETPEYGLVWIPADVGAEWRPYANGRWVDTDRGWTFVAAEPWGWAPFHYGRWLYYPGRGWAWLPGYEWAPAWVTWRYGGGVVGWAPLGPVGVSMVYYGAPSLWLVVGTPYFFRPLAWRYYYPTARVGVVLRSTYFAGVPRRGAYLSPPRTYFARLARREAVHEQRQERPRASEHREERPRGSERRGGRREHGHGR